MIFCKWLWPLISQKRSRKLKNDCPMLCNLYWLCQLWPLRNGLFFDSNLNDCFMIATEHWLIEIMRLIISDWYSMYLSRLTGLEQNVESRLPFDSKPGLSPTSGEVVGACAQIWKGTHLIDWLIYLAKPLQFMIAKTLTNFD